MTKSGGSFQIGRRIRHSWVPLISVSREYFIQLSNLSVSIPIHVSISIYIYIHYIYLYMYVTCLYSSQRYSSRGVQGKTIEENFSFARVGFNVKVCNRIWASLLTWNTLFGDYNFGSTDGILLGKLFMVLVILKPPW